LRNGGNLPDFVTEEWAYAIDPNKRLKTSLFIILLRAMLSMRASFTE